MLAVAGEQPDAVARFHEPKRGRRAASLPVAEDRAGMGWRPECGPLGQHRHAMGDRRVRCRLEPNRRLAILFKCANAAGGAAIANRLLS